MDDDELFKVLDEVTSFSSSAVAPTQSGDDAIDDAELNDLLTSLGAAPTVHSSTDSLHIESWGESQIGGASSASPPKSHETDLISTTDVIALLRDLDLGAAFIEDTPPTTSTSTTSHPAASDTIVEPATDSPIRKTTALELEEVVHEIEWVAEHQPVEVPDIVAHYSTLHRGEKLGLGNFGNSFRGIWEDFHVKIKRLHLQEPRDLLRDLMHEDAETISLMDPHPAIAPLYAITTDEVFCTVQQYVAGTPLWGYIRNPANRGIDPLRVQVRLLKEIAEALHHLHNAGVLHLALRTKNIFVDRDQRIIINDYGFEALKEHLISGDGPLQDIRGIAPEVLLGEPAGPPADVFSMGFVMWGMFAGKTPYMGYSNEEVRNMVLANMRPELPPCPQRIGKLIQACWNTEPSKRPPLRTVLAILSYPVEQIIKGDPIYELTGGVGLMT